MLTPKRVKWRKVHRGRMTGKSLRGSTLTFGEFGLQALEPCWMTNRQIEAARIAMTRHMGSTREADVKTDETSDGCRQRLDIRVQAASRRLRCSAACL